ncbi:MAG: hypothetical protein C0487_13795 [Leptothrix sp. (in: Bacteria)]|nr:hypothetical protein [Leptothrix sp. (in: b-proteobacteria)]
MPNSHQNWRQFGKRLIACVAIAALQINTMAPVWAALAQKPLLSSSGVLPKPNVILSLDNSESMALNHMPESLAGTNIVRMHPEDNLSIASHSILRSVAGYVPATGKCVDNVFECMMRSPDVNTIYYNPATYYRPWIDANNPSARLPDSSFTAAPIDPLNRAKAVNLSVSVNEASATPIRWCRSGNDCSDSRKTFTPGIYYKLTGTATDQATSYTLVNVGTDAPTHGRRQYSQRLDCPNEGLCTQDAEKTNFANWFTYYRARILFTKAALSEAFATQGDTIRLGWGFTSSVTKETDRSLVTDPPEVDGQRILGGPSQGVRDFTDSHKLTFLAAMQNISLRGSTPLRFVMDGVGQYFKNSDRPWQDNPASGSSTGTPLSCRRAYNILTTDGYYNDNGTVHSTVNYTTPTNHIGDVDGQTIVDVGATRYTPTKPYSDAANASTLADIAMYYWAHDLNTSIPNKVLNKAISISDPDYYDTSKDPATWQHLTQFTVGVGVSGSLNPATDLAALKNGTKVWPKISSDASKIDDLWHAAVNSRGQFYVVKDASTFKTAIKNAIGQTQNAPQSEGGVATAGTTIQSSTRKYISSYITNKDGPWSGDFYAYNLTTSGKVDGEKAWSVTEQANGKTPGVPPMNAADRNIVIWNADAGADAPTVFDWASMGASNQALMPGGSEQLVKYLRGDTSKEGPGADQYRERNGARFADFVNSNIVYVKDHVNLKYGGLPAVAVGRTTLPTGDDPTGYGHFLDRKALRKPAVVFIGSNGGFLHGFQDNAGSTASEDIELNKRNGTELFAFVPRGVLSNLPKLAQQDYGRSGGANEHQYFVDGLIAESDAYFRGAWRNVLVGSLGAGGKGIYALDVTKLDALGTGSLLWDKTVPNTAGAGADVGYIVTPPQVGVLPNGEWKVFVGNGYDSTSGQAALLIYSMSDGTLESIPVGGGGGNGLGGVVLVRNSNQEVVGAYAGDLQGNLWRFEYSPKTGAMVKGYDEGSSKLPLFIAKSDKGATQPITAAPAVLAHPSGGNVIVFGTGKLLESTDKSNSLGVQSVYGIWDKMRVALDVDTTGLSSPFTLTGTGNPRDGVLIQQTITAGALAGAYNVSSAQQTSSSLGWFMDLTIQDGQRLIYPVQSISNYVLLGTVVPSATATDCENLNAKGYNFLLPGLTGAQANVAILDINGDGVVTKDDGNYSGYETGADGNDIILPGGGGGGGPGPSGPQCSIQNTAGDVQCELPRDPEGGYELTDRVWKRLLNVPQPAL